MKGFKLGLAGKYFLQIGIMASAALIITASLYAQTTESSSTAQAEPIVMNTADMAAVKTLSEAELAALVSALDVTPQISYDDLPETSGTFYSLQNPDWPPLPGNVNGSSVWQMNGFYLLNDVYFNYSAPTKSKAAMPSSSSGMMTMSSIDPGDPGDGGTNTYEPNYTYTAPDYGTNLWVAQVALSSGYLTSIASNTLPGVYYEVQTNADLTTTNWGTFAQYPYFYGADDTNWTLLDAIWIDPASTNLFFRLRSWGSSDGSGLPDWWEQQYGVTDPYGDPDGDGWNNFQEFQNGTDPLVTNTPPAPQGLTVNLHQTSQTASLNWLVSPGQIASYTVEKTDANPFSPTVQTFTVSSGTTFSDDLSGNSPDPWNGDSYDISYRFKANYASGMSSVWSTSLPLQPVTV